MCSAHTCSVYIYSVCVRCIHIVYTYTVYTYTLYTYRVYTYIVYTSDECLALSGGSGGTARNSKRSLLPDLMMEGEQSPEGSLDVPSSPPKKFKLDNGRPGDPSMPSRSSDPQLPNQASMHDDRSLAMIPEPGQIPLIGAESLVSRQPIEYSDVNDNPRSRHHAHDVAAEVRQSELAAQHAEPDSWYSAPQGASVEWTDTVAHSTGQLAAVGLDPGQFAAGGFHSEQPAVSGPQPGQVPGPDLAWGQFWDRVDDQIGQQTFGVASFEPGAMEALHASHVHQVGSFQANVKALQQSHHQQMWPSLLSATETAAWPVLTTQTQQQQQQQQMRFPAVTDFNLADFHTSVASPSAVMSRVVSGTQEVWDSPSSAGSYSTESEANESEEQIMCEGRSETPQAVEAGNASWPEQSVPQVQRMSRVTNDGDDVGHEVLQHAFN